MTTTSLRPADAGRLDPREDVPAARPGLRRAALAAGVLVGFAGLVVLLSFAARTAFGGNSDSATIVLEGRSLASGHLALGGWALSYDSFWTLEVPFYALGVGLIGVGADLMALVPALFASLLVVAAAWLASDGRRDVAAGVGAAAAVAFLGLPGADLSYFLLQAGWHAATALVCLLAFAGVARGRSRPALAAAVVLLAAALLGDLLSLTLAIVPLALAGCVAVIRERRLVAGARHAVAIGGGFLLALAVRGIALLGGTYSVSSRSVLANRGQISDNLSYIPGRVAALFGAKGMVPTRPSPPAALVVVHGVLFGLVLVAIAWTCRTMLMGVLARRSGRVDGAVMTTNGVQPLGAGPLAGRTSTTAPPWVLDDLLLVAVVADLASFVVFATEGSTSLARYLLPGYVFAVVLACRVFVRALRALRARPGVGARRALVGPVGVAVALVGCAIGFATQSVGAAAPQPARQLTSFLVGHHLTQGVGDYWSSSIVTVDSSGRVAVRPVAVGADGRLVRYAKQSTSSWYTGHRFQFFVYDAASQWEGVNSGAAEKTFGAPARIYAVGGYRVLVFPRPMTVAAEVSAN